MRQLGLYQKFDVHRLTPSSRGIAHDDRCEYFVLDATHDPLAYVALAAYAEACRESQPGLAADLDALAQRGAR